MPIPETPIQRDNTATNFLWTKDGNQYLQGELYLAAKRRREREQKEREEAERKAKQERFANMSDAERQSWVQDQWDKTEGLGEGNSATEWYHAIEEDPQKEAEWDRNAAITSSVGSAIVGLPFSIGSIGLIPTLTTTATGYAGAYGGQKLGEAIDEKYGTNLAPWFSTIGRIIGGGAGYKGTVNLGSKGLLPKGGQTMYGKQFITDVASDALNRNVTQIAPTLNYGTVKYYGPTMGKTTAAKTNPNLVDFDDYVRGDLEALASQSGMTRQQLMMSQDPTVRENARQLMLKSIKEWRQNPSSYGKTMVVSKSDVLQDLIFDNQPLVLQRPEFLKRNAARGETDLQNSMDWYASTRRKGGNKLMEWPDPKGVYVSELEPFTPDLHHITFTPQSSKGTYTWFERPSKLTEAERLGIPKGERNNGKNLLSMQDLVPQKFTSIPGLKPIGGKMIADKVINHPHILDRTRRLQQTYKRIVDPDYTPTNNWRKSRNTSPGMKIVDDIDVVNTNSPTGTVENIGGYYNPSEDVIYVRRRGTPDAQASTAFHENLHGYDFGRDEINDWIIKHLIDPEKVKGMSPRAQKYYLSSQEAPVHALQQGFIKDLDIGAPYPGNTAFDELLDSGLGGSLYYFKTQTPKDKRRLWRAMTGDLFVKKQGGKL